MLASDGVRLYTQRLGEGWHAARWGGFSSEIVDVVISDPETSYVLQSASLTTSLTLWRCSHARMECTPFERWPEWKQSAAFIILSPDGPFVLRRNDDYALRLPQGDPPEWLQNFRATYRGSEWVLNRPVFLGGITFVSASRRGDDARLWYVQKPSGGMSTTRFAFALTPIAAECATRRLFAVRALNEVDVVEYQLYGDHEVVCDPGVRSEDL